MVLRRVWPGPAMHLMGTPSPDGNYLACMDWETGNLALRGLATGERRRLTNYKAGAGGFAESAVFSPDGRWLAYDWFDRDWTLELRVIGIDGSHPRSLYRQEAVTSISAADWSPDGRSILALLSHEDGRSQIALVPVQDGSVRVLQTLDGLTTTKMGFSPDGRFIAYDAPARRPGARRDVFVLPLEGGHEIPVVEHMADDFFLGWAPDGRRVLFISDRTGSPGIWMVRVSQGRPRGDPEPVRLDVGRIYPLGFIRSGACYYSLNTGMEDVYVAMTDRNTGKLLGPPVAMSQRFVGANAHPDWSPDGQYLAYRTNPRPAAGGAPPNTLTIRSLGSGKERAFTTPLRYIFPSTRWSPDSRSILVTGVDRRGRHGLFRIDAQTGKVSLIAHQRGVHIRTGDWLPDGRAVLYNANSRAYKGSRFVLHDLETGREKIVYRGEFAPAMALSPNGSRVAFWSDGSLKTMPVAGGRPRELIQTKELIQDVTWTPDGRYLLFAKHRSTSTQVQGTELWRIAGEGGAAENLGLAMAPVPHMRVHPDGRRIAFTSGKFSSEVWVMENFLPR
jgi:Tol biopolymer transport system component